MKNELERQKKGDCKRTCVPIGFKIGKKEKKMNIGTTKDGTRVLHSNNMTSKWGCGVPGSSSKEEKETQTAVKERLKIV